jgi:LuxR family transcriptional regulator, maltose regulon positive regulatory protein
MTRISSRIVPSRSRGPERAAQPVRVKTLGGFAVSVGSRGLEFGRKAPLRPLNLLKYLAAHGGHELPGVQVAGALWPDRPARPALGSLAVTIHRLRRLLGEPDAVSHRDGAIALDARHVWCDAVAFERMLDQSARSARESERLRLTARAMALYRGDFLAGEGRHDWVTSARERLRERFVLACAAQGERFAAAARWDEARACFQRGLEVDEAAEDLCLGLMTAYAALGQPLTAATVFRRFALALAHRSGARPASPTRALHQELLREVARPGPRRAATA